jgi:biotin operon repressor
MLKAALEFLGARVTSWKRSTADNTSVGGAPASFHLIGAAIDFGRETPQESIDALRSLGFTVEWHEKGTAPHYHAYGSWKTVALIGTLGAATIAIVHKALAKRG